MKVKRGRVFRAFTLCDHFSHVIYFSSYLGPPAPVRSLVALNHPALRAYSELPHDNTRAAGASHALLHAHRVKTARTSPRARKHAQRHFRAVPCASALCWRPMAVPRRPHQLRAPRTTRGSRISTHAATRAPQHTSPAHLRLFAPCAELCRLLLASHKRLY